MGRAMIIYVVLLLSIFGFVVLNIHEDRQMVTRGNVSSYEATTARNASQSGLELAMQVLSQNDYDLSSVSNPLTFTIGEADVSVDMYNTNNSDLRYNQIRLISTGTMGDHTSEVTGMFRSNYPTPRGAMGFYGNNDVTFSAGSNSFEINGHDNAGDKPSMPAIMAQGNNSYNDILGDIPSKREDNIIGEGGNPSVDMEPRMDPKELTDLIPQWESNADTVIGDYGTDGDEPHSLDNSESFGTTSDPEITVVRDGAKFQGGNSGAGIMIIQDGAELEMGNNFEFDGLIINNSQNAIFNSSGSPTLRGALMSVPPCGTTSSDCTASIDFKGGINVQYDSDALYKMQQGLTPSKNEYDYHREDIYF